MKTITFVIPDWAENKPLNLFAGSELLAQVRKTKVVVQKVVRCNQCGECCRHLDTQFFQPTVGKICIYLQPERGTDKFICALGFFRPFGCSIAEPIGKEYCCITHEERDFEGNLL